MLNDDIRQTRIKQAAMRALSEAEERKRNTPERIMPPEINGCKGSEPTRFDDWERKGIAYDF
jgi:hypothetical protein